jgi:Tol biopolymer transport system component
VKNGENYQQMSERGAKQLWTMWSADGKQMYYVSDRNGTQNIWTQTGKAPAKMLTNFTDGRVCGRKFPTTGSK